MRQNSESGHVFYIIVLSIFLFGALMFTFTKSTKQGVGRLTQKQAALHAGDVLTFSQNVQRGVDRVYSKGCSESELSFDTLGLTGYTNGSAPPDNHCHIFDVAGGAVTFVSAPQGSNDGSEWIVTGSNNVEGSDFGSSASDLVLLLPNVNSMVCTEINKLLNISGAPTETGTVSTTKFQGSFPFPATEQIGSGDGARAECTTDAGGSHRFYNVLLER